MNLDPQENWQVRYAAKIASAEQAVRLIPPRKRILIGSGAAEPGGLVEAMVTHGTHLEGNEIVHLMTLGSAPYVQPGLEGRFRHTAFFIGANVRQAVQEGRADFMPVFLSEIPQLIASGRVHVGTALIQVSPPDRLGFVSLGVSVDVVRAAVDTADLVLAEVNPNMPRTLGDSFLHVDRIAQLVPVDVPLPELIPEPPDDASREIGRNVASLIPDGATLQLGIGRIPDATLAALADRSDLGIHTEMLRRGDAPHGGGRHHRPAQDLPAGQDRHFLRHGHAPALPVGARQPADRDAAERLHQRSLPHRAERPDGGHQLGAGGGPHGPGGRGHGAGPVLLRHRGQVDFIRGASRSRGGRPIIALPSTARQGTVSRIQAAFEEGTGVVTSRGDIHYAVTEYGIADLWGKSIRQRAEALIGIAHPDFRAGLLAAARQRRYVFPG
jgi:acyl-CoA hydrolase